MSIEHIKLPFQDSILSVHTPRTLSQKRASAENFALRQLAGMASNLCHLRGVVPDAVIKTITHATERGIVTIKSAQWDRKKARLQKELAAMDLFDNFKEPV